MKIGFVIDPIVSLKAYKDSTVAMMQAAINHGYEVYIMQINHLHAEQGKTFANMQQLKQIDLAQTNWYKLSEIKLKDLADLDVIVMRKDPPFDMDYIYATYLLELAEKQGVKVINKPQSLRDANEKCFIMQFPHCITDTLVSADPVGIKTFLHQHTDIIVKPLDGMGGSSIYRLTESDHNINVILETMTMHGKRHVMAQRYLSEIKRGDKRIILIDGKPVPFVLARMPLANETRANMAAGGKGVAQELSDRDRWLCDQVGPKLKAMGLYFVGLDVIGDYITEINVTSPTGIRELNNQCGLDIAGDFMRFIADFSKMD